ncbi:tyrosine-protein phosphatase [Streptomyces kaniharaensis]|uniref:Tyrosine-protein phosphatase n=1 Tax=Streptomyces kaniharaensis TaxID=212423 RepID=A0A6N7KS00_9ACTN|nr:tyrosine-protein phosphatase [Streptomyces kaniharaensis]MQS14376.1 tyrosine-protein phosphatase [Streptomyces kaniharaensis]
MSLVNFRDPALLGDPDGRRVRPGVLYRSAQPFPAADAATVAQLRACDIRTIVDLRDTFETDPADWAAAEAAGIAVVAAPVNPATDGLAERMRTMTTAADLGHFYVLMAESAPAAVVAAVEAAARPGAVLLHCAAGKDRTGLLTALLLDLLDVPADRIVADYVRTADALPEIFAGLAERHRTALNGHRDVTIPAPLLQAPAEAMAVFLDQVRTRHGGAASFLPACGVTPEILTAFLAKAAAEAGHGLIGAQVML